MLITLAFLLRTCPIFSAKTDGQHNNNYISVHRCIAADDMFSYLLDAIYDVGFQTSSSLTENACHSELGASGFLFPLYKRMKGTIHGKLFRISEFIIISEALSQISFVHH